tara:strand:- start:8904 stop:11045 length:2142 start_codon:yes stop_codon:yes gene_type:complete
MDTKDLIFIIKDLLLLLLVVLTYVYFKKKHSTSLNSPKFINVAIATWIVIFLLEYFIAGSSSYIHYYDEADGALSRYLFHNQYYQGGDFLHGPMGGMNHLAQQLTGGQYYSLERGLLSILPITLAIIIHKLMLISCSLIGMYLLMRKSFNVSRVNAFYFSTFFSVFNPYAVYSTIHHGIGYAILPLAIYIFASRSEKNHYYLGTFIISLIITVSSVPTHSMFTTCLALLLWASFHPPKNLKRFVVAITSFIIIYLLNWYKVLLAMKALAPFTSRVIDGAESKSFSETLSGTLVYVWGKTSISIFQMEFSPLVILLALAVVLLLRSKQRGVRLLLLICTIIFIPCFIYYLSMSIDSLNFLNTVNFYRLAYFLPIPVSIAFARYATSKRALIFLFLAFAILQHGNRKFEAVQELLIQNQKSLKNIPNLTNQTWAPATELFRVATANLPYKSGFHPNFAWVYGLDSIDGYSNLVPHIQNLYWYYGVHKNTGPAPSFIGGNHYLSYGEVNPFSTILNGNPSSITIKERVDLNLLRLMNVKYIISSIPVEDLDGLVSSPVENHSAPQGIIAKLQLRLSNIRKAKNLYIYDISNAMERAYFPTQYINMKTGLSFEESLRVMSNEYCSTCLYASTSLRTIGTGAVTKIDKVPNGYDVYYENNAQNILILNQFYHPHWEAFEGDRELKISKVNIVQFGVYPSESSGKVSFRFNTLKKAALK